MKELYDDTLEVVHQGWAEGSVGEDLIGYLLRAEDPEQVLFDRKAPRNIMHLPELELQRG